MGDTLRSILTRLVAYLAVAIAAGLLFLAGATIYQLMWPRPVVPLSQMLCKRRARSAYFFSTCRRDEICQRCDQHRRIVTYSVPN